MRANKLHRIGLIDQRFRVRDGILVVLGSMEIEIEISWMNARVLVYASRSNVDVDGGVHFV